MRNFKIKALLSGMLFWIGAMLVIDLVMLLVYHQYQVSSWLSILALAVLYGWLIRFVRSLDKTVQSSFQALNQELVRAYTIAINHLPDADANFRAQVVELLIEATSHAGFNPDWINRWRKPSKAEIIRWFEKGKTSARAARVMVEQHIPKM